MPYASILATLQQSHAHMRAGDGAGFHTAYSAAGQQIEALPDAAPARALRGEYALLGALLHLPQPALLCAHLERAQALLGGARSQVITQATPLTQCYEDPFGLCITQAGQVDAHIAHFERAATLYDQMTGSGMAVVALLHAQAAYLRGDFAGAETQLHKVVYLADSAGQHCLRLMAARMLAHIARYRYDVQGWRCAVALLGHIAAQAPHTAFYKTLATLLHSELMLTQQMTDSLPAWLREGDFGCATTPLFGRNFKRSGHPVPPSLYLLAFWLHVYCLSQQGQHARCLAAIEVLRDHYGAASLLLGNYLHLLRGISLLALGERDQARSAFAAAVAGCAPDGLWLIAAEFAGQSDGLIEEAARAYHPGHAQLGTLVHWFEAKYPQLLRALHQGEFIHELSLREREVAQLAAKGLSNRAVAEQLQIAESTVKSHLTHIFGKLAVRNRTQLAIELRALQAAQHASRK